MRPAEGVELGDIDELAHGAIRLGGIEGYFAFKTYGLDDQLAELANGELLAGAHIDVAVADLAQRGDVAATAGAVVSIHCTIGTSAEMYRAVLFNSNNITKVDIEEYMY